MARLGRLGCRFARLFGRGQRGDSDAVEVYLDVLFFEPLTADPEALRRIRANAFVRLGDMLGLFKRWDEGVNAYESALVLVEDLKPAIKGMKKAIAQKAKYESMLKKLNEAEEADEADQASEADVSSDP